MEEPSSIHAWASPVSLAFQKSSANGEKCSWVLLPTTYNPWELFTELKWALMVILKTNPGIKTIEMLYNHLRKIQYRTIGFPYMYSSSIVLKWYSLFFSFTLTTVYNHLINIYGSLFYHGTYLTSS